MNEEEIIKKLTKNGEYANDICLLLLINDKIETLNYLYQLNITGRDLESLYNKCCFEQSLDCLTQTTRYLRSGFLDYRHIFLNLRKENPVPFINRLIKDGEDWEFVYENYTSEFFENLNKSNHR